MKTRFVVSWLNWNTFSKRFQDNDKKKIRRYLLIISILSHYCFARDVFRYFKETGSPSYNFSVVNKFPKM